MNEIQMVQFAGGYGVASFSPFCLKLQAYLRLTGIPYRAVNARDTSKAPTGKMPYTIDGSQTVGDSGRIISHLKSKSQKDPDAGGYGVASFSPFCLEVQAYLRLTGIPYRAVNARKTSKAPTGKIPTPIRLVVVPMLVRRVRRSL